MITLKLDTEITTRGRFQVFTLPLPLPRQPIKLNSTEFRLGFGIYPSTVPQYAAASCHVRMTVNQVNNTNRAENTLHILKATESSGASSWCYYPHLKTTCKYSRGIIASGLQVSGARGGFLITPPRPVSYWDKYRNSTQPSFF